VRVSKSNSFPKNNFHSNDGGVKTHSLDLNNMNFFSSLNVLCHATATPLTNILINLDLLMRDQSISDSKSNTKHYLRQALISAKYLKGLMSQCSNHSTIQAKFKIKDTLMELIEICKKPNLKGHLVHYFQLTGDEQIEGNKLYFQEAIICLLNNAFQAYQEYAANKLVVIIANIDGSQLQIKVVDGATGLLELNDNHLTQAEIESPISLANMGTGLKFTEHVITNHFSGSLKIESRLKKGTTVHCSFPLANST
jgi:signal transduction histidine kinase